MSRVRAGFSLVEILVVMSILILLFTLGIANFVRSQQLTYLRSTGTQILSLLEFARHSAVVNELQNDCTKMLGYEVELNNDSSAPETATLTINYRCSDNTTHLLKTYTLSHFSDLTIVQPSSLPDSVFFQKLTALTGKGEDWVICLKNSWLNKYFVIKVSEEGVISYDQEAISCL